MKTQSELIGAHPVSPQIFGVWLAANDIAVTATKRHRSLNELIACTSPNLIDWLARKLIVHHYSDDRLNKLKQKFGQLGFPAYAEQHRKLPRADRTMKGNAIEILLIEYIEGCQGKQLIKNYKLRYNPNVDQAIKGDDTLLINLFKDQNNQDAIKIFLGESKFRATSSAQAVTQISDSLQSSKKPISYSFLVDELRRDPATADIANLLDNFIVDEIKQKGDITYAGLLFSDANTSNYVENNLNNNNETLVFLSMGINNPAMLITAAFQEAERLLTNPHLL